MSDPKFRKTADEEHEVQLESHLISASWSSAAAWTGREARFEVRTMFVGDGAKIKLEGKSEKGKKLGKIDDVIRSNIYTGGFDVPEDTGTDDRVFFEVELPSNGLKAGSGKIPVLPAPKLKDIRWSAEEARRGDTLTLHAELEDVQGSTEAKLVIYEYDSDGAHDRITSLSARVSGGKIEESWDYEYHEDTDELPTREEVERYGGQYNPPEYFFTVLIGDFELGREDRDSGLLRFKDYLELKMLGGDGTPVPNVRYKVHLPDGEERSGQLDDEGYAREDAIPPGLCRVEFEDEE